MIIEERKKAIEHVKMLVKAMHTMSEENFNQEYRNNVHFHRGFHVLVDLVAVALKEKQKEERR